MDTQFITDKRGKKTAVIIPISENEDLLHQHHINIELTDEYRKIMDSMLDEENNAGHVPFGYIKRKFNNDLLKKE